MSSEGKDKSTIMQHQEMALILFLKHRTTLHGFLSSKVRLKVIISHIKIGDKI